MRVSLSMQQSGNLKLEESSIYKQYLEKKNKTETSEDDISTEVGENTVVEKVGDTVTISTISKDQEKKILHEYLAKSKNGQELINFIKSSNTQAEDERFKAINNATKSMSIIEYL